MPRLISLADKTRTRYTSRLVLCQHFPLMSPLIAVFFHRVFPLLSHILVIMGASGYTWLKHLSKEGGLIPQTLVHTVSRLLSRRIRKIKFPACSHCHITPKQPCVVSLCKATRPLKGALSALVLAWRHRHTAVPPRRQVPHTMDKSCIRPSPQKGKVKPVFRTEHPACLQD